jgi:Tfp pilus assembly protein PilF
MRRRHYVVFALLVGLGLAASLLLITRRPEQALISYRDKNFDEALRRYEARLKSGDLSPAVVMPLSQLYLQFGNVDAAVALMERYVREHPEDVTARTELGRYYQFAQRGPEYLAELEALSRLSPSEQTLRSIAEIYSFQSQFDEQIATLQRIVELYPGSPQDLIDMATLMAARGRLTDAAAALRRLHEVHPDASTPETIQFLLSTLLDSGQPDAAVTEGRQWLQQHRDPVAAARLASIVGFKGNKRQALDLLEPFVADAARSPELLSELTQLELANGLQDRALARLVQLDRADRLPPAALEPYLDLLLTSGQTGEALEVAQRRNIGGLPPWLLTALVDRALAAGQLAAIDRITERAGSGFFEQAPLLGARLALARNDRAGAERWMQVALARQRTPDETIGLAQVYLAVGESDTAIDLLRPLTQDPSAPDAVVVDLANLYLDAGRAEEGLPVVAAARARRRSAAIDGRWALLAAKAGDIAPVRQWLQRTPDAQVPDDVLTDLFYVASDSKETGLAAEAAARLFARRGTPMWRLQLATALSAAGRPAEALPHFRALLPGDAAIESGYVEALRAAEAMGVPVRDEQRRYWAARLAKTGLSEQEQEEVVYALLDLEDLDAAVPALARLARREGGQWLSAYADAAVKAGRTADLVELLASELDRDHGTSDGNEQRLQLLREHGTAAATLPYLRRFADARGGEWLEAYEAALVAAGRPDERARFWRDYAARGTTAVADRRGIAFRSLEAGEKAIAESIWRDLAANAAPDSPDVSQLLYLWGPRPRVSEIDWIAARAEAASGQQREAWMRHLVDAGAPRRALDVGKNSFSPAYLDALVAAADGSGLNDAVVTRVAATSSPDELRRLGNAALQLGQRPAMRAAFGKLLTLAPDDQEALRRLGALDFAESRFADARARLERYAAGGGADPESLFYLGELLTRERDMPAARGYFERSLAAVARVPQPGPELQAIRALALHRVGRLDESFAAFEALMKAQPRNTQLRADYAAALMQSARYEEARRVLAVP